MDDTSNAQRSPVSYIQRQARRTQRLKKEFKEKTKKKTPPTNPDTQQEKKKKKKKPWVRQRQNEKTPATKARSGRGEGRLVFKVFPLPCIPCGFDWWLTGKVSSSESSSSEGEGEAKAQKQGEGERDVEGGEEGEETEPKARG